MFLEVWTGDVEDVGFQWTNSHYSIIVIWKDSPQGLFFSWSFCTCYALIMLYLKKTTLNDSGLHGAESDRRNERQGFSSCSSHWPLCWQSTSFTYFSVYQLPNCFPAVLISISVCFTIWAYQWKTLCKIKILSLDDLWYHSCVLTLVSIQAGVLSFLWTTFMIRINSLFACH